MLKAVVYIQTTCFMEHSLYIPLLCLYLLSNISHKVVELLRPAVAHSVVFNSLAPEKFEWNFRHVIFKQILVIDSWGISCEIALDWMSLDLTEDKSTLVQVMAWCRQATSHYLSQCWPRSVSPYGVTRPQWVNSLRLSQIVCHFNKQK